jgi:hypothetical protein
MTIRTITTTLLIALAVFSINISVFAQSRDHLTEKEVDLVKEAQILDKRIDVFVRASERRVIAITNASAANAKQLKKETELWGELPTGTRAQLVGDIARIFDEAITNIDDVSARDERNPLIPKALRRLAAAVNTIMVQLTPLASEAKEDGEIANFELLNEDAKSILEAVAKLPPEVDKKTKKKEKTN